MTVETSKRGRLERGLRIGRQLLIAAELLAMLVAAALVPSAWAAEQATLSNGFAMRCDHHAQVEGRVRLYLSAGETTTSNCARRRSRALSGLPMPVPARHNPQPAHTERQRRN